MAVYERVWRTYEGPLTRLRWRFLVITRYALKDAFASRLFTAFYAACALPTLVGIFLVYLSHNMGLMQRIGMPPDVLQNLTMAFFHRLFAFQAVPAFFITVIVTPSLVAPDLANNALPLILSRPVNRRDYVLGKMAVLAALLSPVTWIGGLTVWMLQSLMEGGGWWWEHVRIALAYTVGHGTWIVVISLVSLAICAWVRFKPVARGVLVGVYLILGGLSEMINFRTGTHLGDLIDLVDALHVIVGWLFDANARLPLPVWAAWISLATAAGVSLLLLHRKLRAHEVVR
jgi:ABC-2 type transport system permease protein